MLYRLFGKVLLILPIVFLLSFSSLAHDNGKALIEDPRLLHLDTSNGLSQNTIFDLHLDDYGFLWLANEEGLNRFDGHKAIQIPGKKGEFLNNPVYAIFEDSRNIFWVSTGTTGVYQFDPITKETKHVVSHQYLNDTNWQQYAFVINELENGDVLIAFNHQVDLFDYESGNISTLYTLPKELIAKGHLVRTVYKSKNVLFIGTSAGLFAKNLLTEELIKIEFLTKASNSVVDENSVNVKQLKKMPNQQLWIGTVKGLHQLPIAELEEHVLAGLPLPKSHTIDASNNIWTLHYQNQNTVYIGTDQGIYRTNLLGSPPIFLLAPQRDLEAVSDKSVRAIETDNSGNIWFGSRFSGAMFWSSKSASFVTISNRLDTQTGNQLSHNNVLSLYLQDQNSLWVGATNGLNRVDLTTKQIDQFLTSKTKSNIYEQENIKEINSVNNKELWLSTGAGLKIFDIATSKLKDFSEFETQQKRLFESYSWALTKENNSVIWALSDSGLIRYDADNWTATEIDLKDLGLNLSTILNIIGFDKHTSNLLLSDAGRLVGLNTTTFEVTQLHSIRDEGASLNSLPTSWLRDSKNNVWLSYAGKGLYQLDADTLAQKNIFNTSNVLTTNLIYELAQDLDGDLWFSSHSGIHEFSPQTHELSSYGYMQGLSSSEFNDGAFVALADGRLAFGSTNGVTIFKPQEVTTLKSTAARAPTITEVDLSTNATDLPYGNLNNSSIVLEHDDMGLVVYFSSLDYSNIKSDRFNVRLTSSSKVINFPNSVLNKVEISMLSPGQHVLEIYELGAKITEGSSAKLNIRVNYAPYSSPFAYAIYCALVLLALFLFIYRRNQVNAVLAAANERVTVYNNRLTNALKASNSDVWEWSSKTRVITTPRMSQDLGFETDETAISFDKYVALIHEVDRPQFLSAWKSFIQEQEAQFDTTYRVKNANNEYSWFRDIGSISHADTDFILVTGTYTNVTESIAAKEKLKLFADAFKHTRDWVLIFDSDQQPLGANPSFYKSFQIDENTEFKQQLTKIINNQDSIKHKFVSKLSSLKPGEHWKAELEFVLDDRTITTITDINAIEDENDSSRIEYYLAILTDITQQKEAQRTLVQLANYDVLTGLVNRTLLLEKLKQAISYAKRRDTTLAVIFIDLDRFKPINDTFGHEAGDEVIKTIAQRLKTKLRENDIVSRLGGDEFVIVLEEVQDTKNVNNILTEVLELITRPIVLSTQSVSVSASAGIALYPHDASDAESLLRNADVAMYSAKESGKNSFNYFTAAMNEKVLQDMLLQNKLKTALLEGQLKNYYQPIIDINTHQTAGFEMLMRWHDGEQAIPPNIFIPIAEQIGLIVEMTMQAIERGLEDIASWYQEGFEGYIAINLSAKQFSSRPDFEKIQILLARYSLPPSCLRFEITEGLLVDNNDKSLSYMHEMRELGFKISLDDFGTGYSSLRYLKDFPIDVLKIDKSFVDDIGVDRGTESIIKSTLIMTKMLKMDTVAEGIESKSQVDYFMKTNCQYLQGFYFSKPVCSEDCYELLNKNWTL
jgi:diguanylate cyclase (GGDEF)-like protein